ncbi:hypothetical protein DPMN_062130 [Dreissena polymorpha]|uniref:Uncharacterized protein n=1 Tax=Dreissena polymorpha TaxID=45954 RepID=A0A9D4HJ14_DREPO|nr:hypothetical protein DPMN_062130 [Dreissena polymorpha]
MANVKVGTNEQTNQQTGQKQYVAHYSGFPHFHDDRTINVPFRVLTSKNALPLGGHVFQPTRTNLEYVQDIIGTNILTKFHEDRTINVASRVLTMQMLTPLNARRTKAHHEHIVHR